MTADTQAFIRNAHESAQWWSARRAMQTAADARRRVAHAHAERHALRALVEASQAHAEGSHDRFVLRAQQHERERVWAAAHGGQVPHMKARGERRIEIQNAVLSACKDERNIARQRPFSIYLVAHAEIDAIKVGMCRLGSSRISDWLDDGWTLIGAWDVTGELPQFEKTRAHEIERAVITRWRVHYRAGYGGELSDYRRAGLTESAPLSCVSLQDTVTHIRQLVAS